MIKDGLKLENDPDEIRSFLLIGQSNMAGRGEFGEVEEIDNDNCLMLRMGRWQKMREPINTDRKIFGGGTHSGIGLGASFADSAEKELGTKIGLIPCADGGTKLSQWMPGEILFDHAVFMTGLAKRTSTLSAILWHQGESDCTTDERVATYKERFIAMISEMRRQTGAEDLPLIIGEITESASPGWKMGDRAPKLNAIFHEIANELPHTVVVKTTDLALKPDGIHFTAASQRILGKRYFEAYRSLISD